MSQVPPPPSSPPPPSPSSSFPSPSSLSPLSSQQVLHVLKYFPQVRYAIAYGSAVFPQKGYDYSNPNQSPMIDFVFGVDDAQQWHKENFSLNKHHYSSLSLGGPKFVARVQNNHGAHIYYNTYVKIEGQQIKYGVIQSDKLCQDLLQWETFYVSGRMQKPTRVIRDDVYISQCNVTNLSNAVRAALLLLPQKFNEEALYTQIAGLSYLGDFRMKIAENPNKVRNMVSSNTLAFRGMYQDIIRTLQEHFEYIPPNFDGDFVLKDSMDSKVSLLGALPPTILRNALRDLLHKHDKTIDTGTLRNIVQHNMAGDVVIRGISPIIMKYSKSQSIKGIFTSGIAKSICYAIRKLRFAKNH